MLLRGARLRGPPSASTCARMCASPNFASQELSLPVIEMILQPLLRMAIAVDFSSEVSPLLEMDSKAALAKKTVHEIKMVLGMILDSAYQDGLIPRNPARDPRLRNPATGSTPRKALTPEELFSIIRQLPNLSQPHDQRFMALLIYTGMRREEALALRWADIDFERGFIHVHGAITFQGNKPVEGPTKMEKGNRYIPLVDALRPWLLQRSEGNFVVYDKVTSSFVKRMWERIQREINVYGATPHCFRHTFTTIAYHNGVNEKTLQALGGWSDIATMRDIYTHVDFQELQNAKISLNAFFQAKMC